MMDQFMFNLCQGLAACAYFIGRRKLRENANEYWKFMFVGGAGLALFENVAFPHAFFNPLMWYLFDKVDMGPVIGFLLFLWSVLVVSVILPVAIGIGIEGWFSRSKGTCDGIRS